MVKRKGEGGERKDAEEEGRQSRLRERGKGERER